jgi:hypothetical protein
MIHVHGNYKGGVLMNTNYNNMYKETEEKSTGLDDSKLNVTETETPLTITSNLDGEEVAKQTAPLEKAEEKPRMAIITNCGKLNVRVAPNKTAKVLRIIEEGDVVVILDIVEDDEWVYIEIDNNVRGYVMGYYLGEV